jgi:putative oxidoreductase
MTNAVDHSVPSALRPLTGLAGLAHRLTPDWFLALVIRLGVASVFFLSGRSKVDDLFHIKASTWYLFETDYRIPLLPPAIAAPAATVAEHLFPVLLLAGLFTRISALALLAMTTVIEVFVYPDAWPTHLTWAGLLLYLAGRGGGAISLDRALNIS